MRFILELKLPSGALEEGAPILPVDLKICLCRLSLSLIMPMLHVRFKKWPCHMLNSRNGRDAYQQALCCMLNLRNGRVALYILGVKGLPHETLVL